MKPSASCHKLLTALNNGDKLLVSPGLSRGEILWPSTKKLFLGTMLLVAEDALTQGWIRCEQKLDIVLVYGITRAGREALGEESHD